MPIVRNHYRRVRLPRDFAYHVWRILCRPATQDFIRGCQHFVLVPLVAEPSRCFNAQLRFRLPFCVGPIRHFFQQPGQFVHGREREPRVHFHVTARTVDHGNRARAHGLRDAQPEMLLVLRVLRSYPSHAQQNLRASYQLAVFIVGHFSQNLDAVIIADELFQKPQVAPVALPTHERQLPAFEIRLLESLHRVPVAFVPAEPSYQEDALAFGSGLVFKRVGRRVYHPGVPAPEFVNVPCRVSAVAVQPREFAQIPALHREQH